ncbi:piercer of microtubule wall 1 protein [Prorops nasuta]|uniref:piercer of microtubule wall 1 protein n=1 Tax=Prorops nasuta TaxID=863751 RepID=UPI0034CD3B51
MCSCNEKSTNLEEIQKCSDLKSDSESHQICNLPSYLSQQKILKGYRLEEGLIPHPCYRSTSMDYGWHSPSIHNIPHVFYPRNNDFTDVLMRTGMYQNCSLNTELDK